MHSLPSAFGLPAHAPVAGSQVASWHCAALLQVTGLPPRQNPDWHESVWVHALPSSHAAPLGFAGLEHRPVTGLHAPAAWHASDAAQATGFPPTQAPAW